jgi:nitrite reductase/ring-hydroxylating ferredoxin subunit
MAFVKVALMKDLEPGYMIGVDAGGKEIVVVKRARSMPLEIVARHMSCMLSDSTLKEGNATCPSHRSIFDVTTGSIMKGPAKKPEPAYQTKIEGEHILVDI